MVKENYISVGEKYKYIFMDLNMPVMDGMRATI